MSPPVSFNLLTTLLVVLFLRDAVFFAAPPLAALVLRLVAAFAPADRRLADAAILFAPPLLAFAPRPAVFLLAPPFLAVLLADRFFAIACSPWLGATTAGPS